MKCHRVGKQSDEETSLFPLDTAAVEKHRHTALETVTEAASEVRRMKNFMNYTNSSEN